jgi:hypothetical protein
MKNLLFLLSLVALISCSSEDNSVSGCTDPSSVNYNPAATENDNSCQYSIVGNWSVTKYMLGSTNVMEGYSSLVMSVLTNGSTVTEGVLTNGSTVTVNGTYRISGSNNSTLTLTNEFGDTTVWTINTITSTSLSMSSPNVLGQSATIEGVRI